MITAITTNEKSILDYRLKIGDAIKKMREKRGYSQEDLAIKMNITKSTIAKIENGKFSFDIDYLSKFSQILNFDFNLTDKESNNI